MERKNPRRTDIRALKMRLRLRYRQLRQELEPQTKAQWDAKITESLLASPRYRRAERVLLFVSKPIEIDTHALLNAAFRQKKQVLLPRCMDKNGHMAYFRVHGWDDLCEGAFGLLEPDPACCEKIERFSPQDFCLVPGFSFDGQGYRLGFGKGYYDRFLSHFPGVTAGGCYCCCLAKKLPHGHYDRPVDYLFTERYVRRMPGKAAAR